MPDFSFTVHGVTAKVTAAGNITETAHLTEVRELAVSLMAQHGIPGWEFRWDNAKTRAGQCDQKNKVISLSAPLMSLWTRDQAKETILHEIAHALTNPKAPAHGREWQLTCMRIGADPTRTWGHNGEQPTPAKYKGTCPNGHELFRHKLTRKSITGSCNRCSPVFDQRYRFTWVTL